MQSYANGTCNSRAGRANCEHWSKGDYLQHIYNDDDVLVEPDHIDTRPAGNAVFILDFIKKGHPLRCLDYGGGNGKLTSLLREGGVDGHFGFRWTRAVRHRPAPSISSAHSRFWSTRLNRSRRFSQALGLLNGCRVLLFST